jgi:cytochrome P450
MPLQHVAASSVPGSLHEVARLCDPHFYASDPLEVYARLRREAPVFWYPEGELWALSKYADVKRVATSPHLFSSAYGLASNESIPPDDGSGSLESGMPRKAELRRIVNLRIPGALGGESLIASDPPRHGVLRRLVSYAFTPRYLKSLEDTIRQVVVEAIEGIEPGRTVDFVDALAAPIPANVMAHMVGATGEDRDRFRVWVDAIFAAASFQHDPESPQVKRFNDVMVDYAQYFFTALADRQACPRDDLLSHLVHAEVDGEQLSQANQLMMTTFVFGAGIGTTQELIAGGAKLLAEHPDQRDVLIRQPELIEPAIEELVRLVSPVPAFCRTATARTELGGHVIERGDYVLMLYSSANRDEDIWPDADRLDVRRAVDPQHLAFGWGEHHCLGAQLARKVGRIVFEELLRRYPNYEVTGEIERLPSTLSPGIVAMPAIFS